MMLHNQVNLIPSTASQQDAIIDILSALPDGELDLRLSNYHISAALAALLATAPQLATIEISHTPGEPVEEPIGVSAEEAAIGEDNLTGSTGPEPILATDAGTSTQGALAAHRGLFSGHATPSETTPDLRRGVSL